LFSRQTYIIFLIMIILTTSATGCFCSPLSSNQNHSTDHPEPIDQQMVPAFDHPGIYFKPAQEFYFATDDSSNSWTNGHVKAKFINRKIKDSGQSPWGTTFIYHFEDADSRSPVNIIILQAFCNDLTLTPNVVYEIIFQQVRTWIFGRSIGLIISRGTEPVYMGITDQGINGKISIDDSFLQISTVPMSVRQTGILIDRYIDDECGTRQTNAEITFSLGTKSITLHQNQSQTIDNYNIQLLVARSFILGNKCTDMGMNGLSYIICKLNEFQFPPFVSCNLLAGKL